MPAPLSRTTHGPSGALNLEGIGMKPEPQSITVELTGGKTISFETGKLAKQADGAVTVLFTSGLASDSSCKATTTTPPPTTN